MAASLPHISTCEATWGTEAAQGHTMARLWSTHSMRPEFTGISRSRMKMELTLILAGE